MKYCCLILLLFAVSAKGFAQTSIPFAFTDEEENRLIKEEENAKYFVASGDTTNVVYFNDETNVYRLYDNSHKVIVEGGFSTAGDKNIHESKWTQYYASGKIKMTGYYYKDEAIGTWETFYENGKPETIYNYGIITTPDGVVYCLTGSYKEFYESGKLKLNGFYAATVEKAPDTVYVSDPVTQEVRMRVMTANKGKPVKTGSWEHYNEDGTLEKKEDF